MNKNMKIYDEVVAEMNEMVKEAKEKYSCCDEIMKKCSGWTERVPYQHSAEHKETTDENADVIHLADDDAIVTPLTEKVVDDNDDTEPHKNITTEPTKKGEANTAGGEEIVDKEATITKLDLQKADEVIDSLPFLQPENPPKIKRKKVLFKIPITKEPTKGFAQEKRSSKRHKLLNEEEKSPFKPRQVEITNEPYTDDEKFITEYIFAPYGELYTSVFLSIENNLESFKVIFESLFPGMMVVASVIDIWADVLNIDEKKRNKEKSPFRLFLHTKFLPEEVFSPGYQDAKMAKHFNDRISPLLQSLRIKSIDELDCIVHPIISGEHFFAVCFNLKAGTIELLDNVNHGQSLSERYTNGEPQVLKTAVCGYLEAVGHTNAAKLAAAEINIKDMGCRTKKNVLDCGVFLMRHMETYTPDPQWDCGLAAESKAQNRQLDRLRFKYCHKILTHEDNALLQELREKAAEYRDKVPKKDKDALYNRQEHELKLRQNEFLGVG